MLLLTPQHRPTIMSNVMNGTIVIRQPDKTKQRLEPIFMILAVFRRILLRRRFCETSMMQTFSS